MVKECGSCEKEFQNIQVQSRSGGERVERKQNGPWKTLVDNFGFIL